MADLKCALIGYGAWGQHHARALKSVAGVELTAISARSSQSLAKAKADHPAARAYADYRELLAKEKPELAIAAISKRMRVPPEVVRPFYQPHENVLEEIPYVRRDSVQAIFDQYPKEQLKGLSYEKLVDNSLLQRLEESGFIKNLYRR